jgi:hypothetical protein
VRPFQRNSTAPSGCTSRSTWSLHLVSSSSFSLPAQAARTEPHDLAEIRSVLEWADIEFVENERDGVGVRLRK